MVCELSFPPMLLISTATIALTRKSLSQLFGVGFVDPSLTFILIKGYIYCHWELSHIFSQKSELQVVLGFPLLFPEPWMRIWATFNLGLLLSSLHVSVLSLKVPYHFIFSWCYSHTSFGVLISNKILLDFAKNLTQNSHLFSIHLANMDP